MSKTPTLDHALSVLAAMNEEHNINTSNPFNSNRAFERAMFEDKMISKPRRVWAFKAGAGGGHNKGQRKEKS